MMMRIKENNMLNYLLIAVYLIASIAGLILFKLGCKKEFLVGASTGILNIKISFISIVGLLCYLFSFLLYMFIISKFDMSYIVPLTTGIVQIATFIFAIVLFDESVNIYKVSGIFVILIGIYLLNHK